MESLPNPCLIGVDGGGTSCRVALTGTGRRFDICLGPANAATDRGGAIATVRAGIDKVAAQAGLTQEALAQARIHVALAGIKSAEDEQAVARAIGHAHLRVSEDQISTLFGALGAGDGCVVALGTGSFLARQAGGRRQFIGGWGLDLGDEASGAWLGREMLAKILQVLDGVAVASPLSRKILARYGDAAGILEYVAGAGPAELARLAPVIVQYAQDGDALATRLMRRGADYIAAGLVALGHKRGEPVALTGGLKDAYPHWLAADIRADLCPPRGDALDGALFLAGQIRVPA